MGDAGHRRTLGARLRRARRDAGLSQSDLSERSGIPKPTLSRYENDHVSPSLQSLGRLSEALRLPEAELLSPEPTPDQVFLRVLTEEGVTFRSTEEAERLARYVAGHLRRPTRPS